MASCLVALAGCLAGADSSVCDEAAALAIECGGADQAIDFGDCTGALEDAAKMVVEDGCEGLKAGKGDVTSQLCFGPLKKFFPWCSAEDYRCEPAAADLDASRCNGSIDLCERSYSETVFATSHNAFSAASQGFLRPNQSKRMYVQLRDGVRALMLDVHDRDGELTLCHIDCALGSVSFAKGLAEVRDFLECYPNEVLTLIVEPHADATDIAAGIAEAGLDSFAFTHELGTAWPALGEMIATERRLVVFSEQPTDGAPAWFHHQFDHAFDNEFSVKKTADFACDVKRGDASSALFGLNHFLTVLGGDEFLALEANTAASLHGHVEECRDVFGQLPNFLAVDFHDIGDVIDVVRELNF